MPRALNRVRECVRVMLMTRVYLRVRNTTRFRAYTACVLFVTLLIDVFMWTHLILSV